MAEEDERRTRIQRAVTVPDVGRVSPTSPWVDAPTYDGLWWVLDDGTTYAMTFSFAYPDGEGKTWWQWSSVEGRRFGGVSLPDGRKFAPAVPPAAPTEAT